MSFSRFAYTFPTCSTRHELEQFLLEDQGLDFTIDQRVSGVLDQVLGDRSRVTQDDYQTMLKAHILFSRAFRSRLVIPAWRELKTRLKEAFDEALSLRSEDAKNGGLGLNADYIPPLREAECEQYIVSACSTDGQIWSHAHGNTRLDHMFTVQSVSKIVTYNIALESCGEEQVHAQVGREPSGMSFNELMLNEQGKPHNPFINSGAIRTAAMVFPEVKSEAEKFLEVIKVWQSLCTGRIGFDQNVFLAERDFADTNYCLAHMMRESGSLPRDVDVETIVERYLSFCSIATDCQSLSMVAA